MNKQKFTKILKNYHNIPNEDRNKLHDLAKNFPYSQIIHTLVAKANHDAKTEIAEQTLHYAAFYASDRHVLRDIIRDKPANLISAHEATEEVPAPATVHEQQETSSISSGSKHHITVAAELYDLGADRIRNAVLSDLENLKKSKAQYMQWLEEDPQLSKVKSKGDEKKSTAKKSKSSVKPKEKKVKTSSKQAKATAEKEKTPKTKRKTGKESDTAKPKKARSTKQKKVAHDKQREIIDNFINKEPSITAKSLKGPENQQDLSEASTAFNEDLISENLAQIFVNQGKKNKAIDIYKKLIWKFPQKKAYFASRIEELQK
ncbi:hypothetical protein JMN32_27070 [Fulvivirga sp. 29W222]|uniref:Tetratricopeptide repeat protein n=1 Tax=Fulvivirga marina TaxID=2494733 RepID=A0A937KH06_9BACT|nr:hypothetical protein [Fulvivirga marina]MBL6450005.1 hypothetical protein [Fulvivirga marina]